MTTKFHYLINEIERRKQLVREYLHDNSYGMRFQPQHIHDAVYSYIDRGGKSLRPTVLLFSCGAVGGDEKVALPAAAAIEAYHTWTLIHDDIIDQDEKRRGLPTVHAEFRERAKVDLGWEGREAAHYGLSIALLAGDVQQGWSWSLFAELYEKHNVKPELVLALCRELALDVQTTLVEGETLDVQYTRNGIQELDRDLILSMLWKKTGVLYRFAGRAGAAIGLGELDPCIPVVQEVADFCSKCGTAFQVQDDILGIIGDEAKLGKPVGSDIREGKRTLLALKALEQANELERGLLESTLGNHEAGMADIQAVIGLMRKLGAVEYAQTIARDIVKDAVRHLDILPESNNKTLLHLWAEYLVEREF